MDRNADSGWEFTGNHYLAVPWIDPADGAIHGVNVLHRGMASLLSWAGTRRPEPGGVPLLRMVVVVDGVETPVEDVKWERLDRWIPRWRGRAGVVTVTVTICTPGGFDPLAPGGVILVRTESSERVRVEIRLEGRWSWTLRTAASTRPALPANRARRDGAAVVLEAGEMPMGAGLAILASGPGGSAELGRAGSHEESGGPSELVVVNGEAIEFRLQSDATVRGKGTAAFVLGVAPDGDGALAAARRLAGIGAEELVRRARLDLASLNRATDEVAARDIVARNLVFHHYSAAARAIDDDRLYPVLSRSPDHGECAVFTETEALSWSLPAYALTDPLIAREVLLRVLEVYSDRPGNMRRYIDGGILDAGYSLARALDHGLAIERYIEITRDETFADEPLVQQVLRELDEAAYTRLHPEIFLAGTDTLAGGERADYPYVAWDNAQLWRLSQVIDRWLHVEAGGPKPRFARADAEIEASFWQRFTTEVDGLGVIPYSIDLHGKAAVYDDPAGSLRLLPFVGLCAQDDPIWLNTMELLHSKSYPLFLGGHPYPGFAGRSRPGEARFSALCADLLCPWRARSLETLRSLHLPGGVACETWDPATGRAASGPYAASEAGFLVWTLLTGAPRDEVAAGAAKSKKRVAS
ncbi:MAG TPA: hypothetical protein VMM79_11890 [Longimicrobiales bacterium]|nr:hypothetical protein [Longimicrobiales bacterium]